MPIRQPDLACHLTRITISYVADKLGEEAEWLWEFQIDMAPEDGCLWDYGRRGGVPAFTEYGIECLKQIIPEMAAGRAPRWIQSTK